jgi:hypothetical protein
MPAAIGRRPLFPLGHDSEAESERQFCLNSRVTRFLQPLTSESLPSLSCEQFELEGRIDLPQTPVKSMSAQLMPFAVTQSIITVNKRRSVDFPVIIFRFDATRAASGRPGGLQSLRLRKEPTTGRGRRRLGVIPAAP